MAGRSNGSRSRGETTPPAPAPAARFDEAAGSRAAPAAARPESDDGAEAVSAGGTTAADTGGAAPRNAGGTAGRTSRDLESPVREYSPLSTLYPRYWLPALREPVTTAPATVGDIEVPRTEILGYAVGGRTSGFDLVGRHAYDVGARVFTSGGRKEGDVSYEYRGLGNPTVGVAASQVWDDDGVRVRRSAAGAEGSPAAFFVLERERRLAASLRVRRPGVRTSTSLRLSAGLVRSDREVLDDALRWTDSFRLARPGSLQREYAVSFSVSTARSHAFQMGNARGAALFVRARTRDDLNVPEAGAGRAGVDLSTGDLVGRLRAYVPLPGPGFAAPVLAVRASGGMARGPGAQTGYFAAGGAAGDGVSLRGIPMLVGSSDFFPVRGYETSMRSGRYAWSTSLEAARAARARQSRTRGVAAAPRPRLRFRLHRRGQCLGRRRSVRRGATSGAPNAAVGRVGSEHGPARPVRGAAPVARRVRVPLVDRDGLRYYLRLGLPF